MGAAAYNRGTKCLVRQISANVRPVEFEMMEQLNALPKNANAPTPWGEIHFIFGHGGWWATCPTKGSGFWYPSLREAVRSWRVEIYAYENDAWIGRPTALNS